MKRDKQYQSSISDSCDLPIVKIIKQFKTTKNCYYIGDRKKQQYMYKYMDIENRHKVLERSKCNVC